MVLAKITKSEIVFFTFPNLSFFQSEDKPALSLDKVKRTWVAKISRNKDKVEVQSTKLNPSLHHFSIRILLSSTEKFDGENPGDEVHFWLTALCTPL